MAGNFVGHGYLSLAIEHQIFGKSNLVEELGKNTTINKHSREISCIDLQRAV